MTVPLHDLDIMVLDCQTTGANPDRGHLLEIAWAVVRAGDSEALPPSSIRSHLALLPDDAEIPKRVQQITGILPEAMAAAKPLPHIWHSLLENAEGMTADPESGLKPLVIHYARFEIPFLRHLHRHCQPDSAFPFALACTHEVAKRLFPDLPRRGLRALAGYFGYGVSELRRSSDHVAATKQIWHHCAAALQSDYGIHTWQELNRWLAETAPSSRSGRSYPMDPKERQALPDAPGVYRMKRESGDTLYIGKATSLKKRVNSYFQRKSSHSEHVLEMLSQAKRIDAIPTGSAVEAAILESDLIKEQSPPYNIALRMRRRQLWYCTSNYRAARNEPDRPHLFGPFPNKEVIDAVQGIGRLIRRDAPIILDETRCSQILCMPLRHGPDVCTFVSGLDAFTQAYGDVFAEKPLSHAIAILGGKFWRKHLDRLAQQQLEKQRRQGESRPDDKEDTDRKAEDASKELFTWTPDAICGAIAGVVQSASLLLRRARWYLMLSESAVVWESREEAGFARRALVLRSGNVVEQLSLHDNEPISLPPGFRNRFWNRQKCFDIMTFDRMRILTTEMRRLLGERRNVSLHLGQRTVLENGNLGRMLQWV